MADQSAIQHPGAVHASPRYNYNRQRHAAVYNHERRIPMPNRQAKRPQPKSRSRNTKINIPRCSVCGRRIKGHIHSWANRTFCLRCKQYFSKNVTLKKNLERKWMRNQQNVKPIRTLLRRIFG